MKTLRASHRQELSRILDYVHDRKYDLSKLDHNARERTLSIPIALRSTEKIKRESWFSLRRKEKTTTGHLIVRNALGFKVTDNAKIGAGDINTIAQQGGRVVISGSVPVEVSVDVERFEVELLLPDDADLA